MSPDVWPYHGYHVLRDDKVGWNVTRAFPIAQNTDWLPSTSRPTVIVLTYLDVPEGLHCDGFVIDLPLVRPAVGITASPGPAHFFLWNTTTPPAGSWITVSGQIVDAWGQGTPSYNGTWLPARRLGVYRFERLKLTGPLAATGLVGGKRYWLGLYVEQTQFGPNSLHWLAAPSLTAPTAPPFYYQDVSGNYLTNRALAAPQMQLTQAPQATLYYANYSVSAVFATVLGSCTVTTNDTAIFDRSRATVLASLPAPSFDPIGSTGAPVPSASPQPQPSPAGMTPSQSQATTTATPAPLSSSGSGGGASWVVGSPTGAGVTIVPPPSVLQQPSPSPPPLTPTFVVGANTASSSSAPAATNDGATTDPPILSGNVWLYVALASIALLIVAVGVIVIIVIVMRRRRHKRGLQNYTEAATADKTDETRLVPLEQQAPVTAISLSTHVATAAGTDEEDERDSDEEDASEAPHETVDI